MKAWSIRGLIRAFASDSRGSGDLTVSLLLTAAGAVMVGLTVPALFRSSQAASRTFDNQVKVLERGSGTSSSGGAASGGSQSPWEISFGPDGVKASGPVGGGVTGSLSVGQGGISGGARGGGGAGTGSTPATGSGRGSGGSSTGTGSLKDVAPKGNQALIDARM